MFCTVLTSTLGWKAPPGCVEFIEKETGIGVESVAICTQIVALDKGLLTEHVARLKEDRVDVVTTAVRVGLEQ